MRRALSTASLALALLAASFAACAGTSGRPISLALIAEPRGPTSFRTSAGWDVVLEEARVGLRALRVERGDDALALSRVLVPVARAHGGHGVAAGVRAELLGPFEIDALASEPIELGTAVGSSGLAGAVELELGALGSPSVVAWVRGTASREGADVAFAGQLELERGLLVRTSPLEIVLDEGALRLVLRADRWLDQARFESLESGEIDPAGQVALAWSLGLREAQAFAVVWEPSMGGDE